MEKSEESTFCVTTRKCLDIIEVFDEKNNKILEVAIIETRKQDVKLGFRASPKFKYVLIKSEDGIH